MVDYLLVVGEVVFGCEMDYVLCCVDDGCVEYCVEFD